MKSIRDHIKEKAASVACKLIYRPEAPAYADEHIRDFQGCPTVAITPGGRIYAGWYSGGNREPHIDNFNLIVYSDDDGGTWSKPLLVIPSSRENLVQALDIELWTAPDGRLFVYWVQNNVKPADLLDEEGNPVYTGYTVDGFIFEDQIHAEWLSVCQNPDDENPVFSQPRCLDKGFLRCKPLVLQDGRWMNFNYDQNSDRYGYSISSDGGETWEHRYGAKKIPTSFDEAMAYQKNDGTIRMFARTSTGWTAESSSMDALHWTDAVENEVPNADTRLFLSRLPSGRVILITNDDSLSRTRMTVWISEDDGENWNYKRCLDERIHLSYPDADFANGYVYLCYDRERCGEGSAREILFVRFTEEDIMDPSRPIEIRVISKP